MAPANARVDHEVAARVGDTPVMHVALVIIDGVRPREIFAGGDPERSPEALSAEALTPHLHALMRRGVALGRPRVGARFAASGPNFVSLPGYTELLAGHPSSCQSNDCDERPTSTLLDAFAGDDGAPAALGVLSSWSPIGRIVAGAPKGTLVSTGRHGARGFEALPALTPLGKILEQGDEAAPSPGWGDYRPDEHTIVLAEALLAEARPRFVFVSLGDTDERAHAGDYQGYLAALGRADAFVGAVDRRFEAWRGAGEPSLVVVATDHGRAANFTDHGGAYPESADAWLIAAGSGLPAVGDVSLGEPAHLCDVPHAIATLAHVRWASEPGARDLTRDVARARERSGLEDSDALAVLAQAR